MVPQRLHLPGRPAIAAASGEQAGERLGEQAARLPAAPAGSSSEAKRWREDNKRKDVKSGPFSQEEKDTLRRAVEDYAGAPCVPAFLAGHPAGQQPQAGRTSRTCTHLKPPAGHCAALLRASALPSACPAPVSIPSSVGPHWSSCQRLGPCSGAQPEHRRLLVALRAHPEARKAQRGRVVRHRHRAAQPHRQGGVGRRHANVP